MTAFPCNRCGACCRNVHLATVTQYLNRGDGTCKNYDDSSNLCRIYDTRPSICRVDEQYTTHYQTIMPWDAFVRLNLAACEQLIAKPQQVILLKSQQ